MKYARKRLRKGKKCAIINLELSLGRSFRGAEPRAHPPGMRRKERIVKMKKLFRMLALVLAMSVLLTACAFAE